jgi:NAD(P)-dependent dehydrogenase (short-subunit alcohol dehydrogenase family)
MAERVIVTAGAAGIGLAIARAFLATGAQVFICDVDESRSRLRCAPTPGCSVALPTSVIPAPSMRCSPTR